MADEAFYTLPDDLPFPTDGSACNHLPSRLIPGIALPLKVGGSVDLSKAERPLVLFSYPRPGQPVLRAGAPFPGRVEARLRRALSVTTKATLPSCGAIPMG